MSANANQAKHYQNLAREAALALSTEWQDSMRNLKDLADALATCPSAPQGLRDLARRQINTLEVEIGAASAVTSRQASEIQVLARKAEPSPPIALRPRAK